MRRFLSNARSAVNRDSPKEIGHFSSPQIFRFRPASKADLNTEQFWTHYYQDIFWAVLNSNESR